jgi:hypothetical protein
LRLALPFGGQAVKSAFCSAISVEKRILIAVGNMDPFVAACAKPAAPVARSNPALSLAARKMAWL